MAMTLYGCENSGKTQDTTSTKKETTKEEVTLTINANKEAEKDTNTEPAAVIETSAEDALAVMV